MVEEMRMKCPQLNVSVAPQVTRDYERAAFALLDLMACNLSWDSRMKIIDALAILKRHHDSMINEQAILARSGLDPQTIAQGAKIGI